MNVQMPLSHAPSRSCLSISILPPRVCILLWLLSVCPFSFEAPGALLKLTPHSLRNHSHFKTSILACMQMFSRSAAHIHGRYWKIPAEDLTVQLYPTLSLSGFQCYAVSPTTLQPVLPMPQCTPLGWHAPASQRPNRVVE